MLDELIVSNLGILDEVRLEPGPGLVVITGETGTGKTLLLGAVRLLLGSKARRDLVGPHGTEATVQARFRFGDDEVLVARRLSTEGRSKAYMDGLMVPLKTLELRAAGAVELVAQHDHLRLMQPTEVRRLVDVALDESGDESRVAYQTAWEQLSNALARRDELGGDRRALERELATVRHQADEIAAAGFAAGDDTELDAVAGRLRNAQGILEALDDAATVLGEDTVEPAMDRIVVALERAANLDPALRGLAEQSIDLATLVAELRTEVTAAAGDIAAEPSRLADVEERLAVLGDLRRKYGDSLEAVLAFRDAAAKRAAALDELLAEADTLDDTITVARRRVVESGARLRVARIEAASGIGARAQHHLVDLGFSDPVVVLEVREAEPGPAGADRIDLRFASDRALEPAAVSRIASGGELSRLVLALHLAVSDDEASVAVFDEIDAGVGGAVALELARKLANLAEQRQVLCVTHLPQIAAYADAHYVVDRIGTRAGVRRVDGEARVEELSRMLAGLPQSERGRGHAAELLATAGEDRRS